LYAQRERTAKRSVGNPASGYCGAVLTQLAAAVERNPFADRLAAVLQSVADPLRRLPGSRKLLSGTPLGHPLHPFLVTAPIGAWTAATVLDLTGRNDRAARDLVGAGVLMALPTAAAGASDWLDTQQAERRVGSVHATCNLAATAAYTLSWWLRPRHRAAGVGAGLAGALLASAAGWLGGHLTYGLGVGVDTNAFSSGPNDWTVLEADPAEGEAALGHVGGARLAVTVSGEETLVLGERCSHRGGPISEGEIADGCFTCPWHGSRFDARTGEVRRGPASIPQPVYETRTDGGRTEVRRREERALRTNPA
jgi:nitrite reductase/ring-hydroxylating ferredoxin subunit/uncharacterized membrane protein